MAKEKSKRSFKVTEEMWDSNQDDHEYLQEKVIEANDGVSKSVEKREEETKQIKFSAKANFVFSLVYSTALFIVMLYLLSQK